MIGIMKKPSAPKKTGNKKTTPARKNRAFPVSIYILLVLALIGGGYSYHYYLNGTCGKSRVETSITKLQTLLSRWIDEDQNASKAVRAELSDHLAKLHQIKNDAENLAVPQCLLDSKGDMVKAMDASLQAYQLFINNASDTDMNDQFQKADALFGSFSNKVNTIKACAPSCS
jgi:hypothetical protein